MTVFAEQLTARYHFLALATEYLDTGLGARETVDGGVRSGSFAEMVRLQLSFSLCVDSEAAD